MKMLLFIIVLFCSIASTPILDNIRYYTTIPLMYNKKGVDAMGTLSIGAYNDIVFKISHDNLSFIFEANTIFIKNLLHTIDKLNAITTTQGVIREKYNMLATVISGETGSVLGVYEMSIEYGVLNNIKYIVLRSGNIVYLVSDIKEMRTVLTIIMDID